MTAHDKACAAIGIIQQHILAMDSCMDPEKMFGNSYLPRSALEQAVVLLLEAIDDLAP